VDSDHHRTTEAISDLRKTTNVLVACTAGMRRNA
jgi:hypothetical protein